MFWLALPADDRRDTPSPSTVLALFYHEALQRRALSRPRSGVTSLGVIVIVGRIAQIPAIQWVPSLAVLPVWTSPSCSPSGDGADS